MWKVILLFRNYTRCIVHLTLHEIIFKNLTFRYVLSFVSWLPKVFDLFLFVLLCGCCLFSRLFYSTIEEVRQEDFCDFNECCQLANNSIFTYSDTYVALSELCTVFALSLPQNVEWLNIKHTNKIITLFFVNLHLT